MTRGRLVRGALVLIILGALVAFATTVEWREIGTALRSTHLPTLALAAVVNLASLAVKGVRWWVFVRAGGAPAIGPPLRATFVGAALNNILVANSGEAARVVMVTRSSGLPAATVTATLALERLFEMIGYAWMLFLAVLFLDLPPWIDRFRIVAWIGAINSVVMMGYLVRRPSRDPVVVTHPGAGWWTRIRSQLRAFAAAIGGLSTTTTFSIAFVLSVLGWGLQVWTYSLTADAAGFDLSIVGTITAILAVNLGFALRVTPGNVGVFQAMYALAAVAFGMPRELAVAVALLIQAQQIIPVTLIGVGLAPELVLGSARRRGGEEGAAPGAGGRPTPPPPREAGSG